MEFAQSIAEPNIILRAVVGSTVHGVAVNDGLEDRDEMGVCIEPPEYVIGLERFDHWVHRTKPEGVRSEAGDLDLVVYSLRKWMRLALRGNPTVLLLLFAPPEKIITTTPLGHRLRELAPAIAARSHGEAFRGYLQSQRLKIELDKGGRPTRPELIERHGFDTKFAMHMLRLGYQGVEYLSTGRITLPMPEPTRSRLIDLRLGRMPLADALETARRLEMQLERLTIAESPLRPEPDRDAANQFLVDAYREWWGKL
jgi:uncharacterized protein